MTTFDSLDAVVLTICALIPGFIWHGILTARVPRQAGRGDQHVLAYLTLSAINFAPWVAILYPMLESGWASDHPFMLAIALLATVVLSPIGFAWLTIRLREREGVKAWLWRLGFRTYRRIPTAWDYQFSRELPYWAIVRLTDGSTVYGLYALQSFAGDDPGERDLYLEQVFELGEDEWSPVESTGGILIRGHQIASIEFKQIEGFSYEANSPA